MKSVIYRLNSEVFPRVRIGTGLIENKDELIEYVIKKVSPDEYSKLQKGIDIGAQAIDEILKVGIDRAMNKIN